MKKSLLILCVSVAVCSLALSGCESVKPWQRGNLARTEMKGDPDGLNAMLRNHIYFAKEAATGSTGAGGGGCGCN